MLNVMSDRTSLLESARLRLREFGVTLEFDDSARLDDAGLDVTLSRGDARADYSAQVKAPMTLTSVAFHGSAWPHTPLVIGDRIHRRSADAFREARIQFIDTLGNAFIAFDGVFIDVQGRTAQADPIQAATAPDADRRRPANLFSPGRAQIILALLAWPELTGERVRTLATVAGTSVGQAHDALTRLAEAGYLLSASKRLVRSDELLDYWTAAYPTGLGRRLAIARYHGDPGRPISSDRTAYLSGESADGVGITRPATLTVYLDSVDPGLPIANRWSLSPDRVPNVFVRQKFWTRPRPNAAGEGGATQNAPWPLVYADLRATGDARLAEVARTWRAHHARPDQS
jgi:hypothetical protein